MKALVFGCQKIAIDIIEYIKNTMSDHIDLLCVVGADREADRAEIVKMLADVEALKNAQPLIAPEFAGVDKEIDTSVVCIFKSQITQEDSNKRTAEVAYTLRGLMERYEIKELAAKNR